MRVVREPVQPQVTLTSDSVYDEMIICLSGFVIAGASSASMSALSRGDIGACDRPSYAPHQQQMLQHFAPALPALLAHRGGGRCSSSSESVSSHSASPPPRPLAPPLLAPLVPGVARPGRVRTLYACLGESDGELSFEPNQIITNVTPSAEPGWLRGTLNGKSGLVPENYVEPLP